jgi:hypothetical protein
VVYIHESGEHTEIYNEDDYNAELTILKRNDRVEFKVSARSAGSSANLTRATISTESSAKDTLRHMIGREQISAYLEPPPTHTERSKPILRAKERSDLEKGERNATPELR